MERNGGIVTEFNIFFPERFSLDRETYSTGNSKMCKDDISSSLFCKVPDCLNNDLSMERSGFNPKKNSINLDGGLTGYLDSEDRMFSAIQQQSDHALDSCYWDNSGISPFQPKRVDKLIDHNEILNSLSSAKCLDPNLVSDSSLEDKNFNDNSNYSLEDVVPFMYKQSQEMKKKKAVSPVVRKEAVVRNKDRSMPELIPLICVEDDDPVRVPQEKRVEESKLTDSPEMPKLIAFSSVETFHVKKEPLDGYNKNCRVKLFEEKNDRPPPPLGADVDSFLESLADRSQQLTEVGSSAGRSPDGATADVLRQPLVLLRRVSLERGGGVSEKKASQGGSSTEELENEDRLSSASVVPSNDDSGDDDDSLTGPFKCVDSKNSSNETPEIEEIEGVRFFQFRSKSDMEEFHEQIKSTVEDEEMIVPTKTDDITQIKGWRHKYFAPESEFQYPITLESIQAESAGRSNAPLSSGSGGGGANGVAESDKDAVAATSSPEDKSEDPEPLKDMKPSMKDLMIAAPKRASDEPVPVIDLTADSQSVTTTTNNNPKSAFESKLLDDYLNGESALKVRYLEKLNPNILPIPPKSSILSLGKLFKPDPRRISTQVTTLAALKLRNGIALTSSSSASDLKVERAGPEYKPSSLVRLSSPDSSDLDVHSLTSDDDNVPIARFRRQKRTSACKVIPGRRVKRIKSDVSSDQSQRVVLRLTKESKGESEGYKVAEITAEKRESDASPELSSSSSSTSSSSSEDSKPPLETIQAVEPGKLPILKHSLFVKVSESKLVDEFLANLNMLGTSNDVAMLVQSNQSYFETSPVLTEDLCREAVEALELNQDKSEVKKSPKKKLKAWQRYLPKKLNVSLKQKISRMTETKTVSSQIAKYVPPRMPPAKNLFGTSANNTLGKGKRKSIKSKLAGGKLSKHVENVEREKRAIRLPARYLDSAVLAAGSEWVSPVFVEEGEKKAGTRKQLLEVLEKISPPNTEVAITQDLTISETSTSECIVTKTPPCFVKKHPKPPSKEMSPNKKMKLNDEEEKGKPNAETKKVKPNAEAKKGYPYIKTKKVGKGKGPMSNWRHQMKAIDKMVDSDCVRDQYPFPKCPYAHCTRTLEYDRVPKELVCSYDHSKLVEKNVLVPRLICDEVLPTVIGDETPPKSATNNTSKASENSLNVAVLNPKNALPAPLMCNNGNLILTQQVNPSNTGSNSQLAGEATKGGPVLNVAGSNQILLLVPGPNVLDPSQQFLKGKPAILPKPTPGVPSMRWATPQTVAPAKNVSNMNAVWFVQDGELKSSPVLPVFKLPVGGGQPSTPPKVPIPGRAPERRRKSPLSKRFVLDDSDGSESDVDVVTEDYFFDARTELKRSFRQTGADFTNEECELIFAALVGAEAGDNSLSLAGKSRNEIQLMMNSMERLRTKSVEFEKARSCDEMLHMAQYVVRETTKLEKASKCIKKLLRLRNIMLLKRAGKILNDSEEPPSVINKIKYELIRSLALEWETQKKERSRILSEFKSQSEPKSAPLQKKKQIKELNILENEKECCILDSDVIINEDSSEDASHVRKLFEPVEETENLEEPHVQLRILEAPEGCADIEAQFAAFEEKMEAKKQSTPKGKMRTPTKSADGNNSDDDDLLIIDLSGERSSENSPVKGASKISVDSPNSSLINIRGKQSKENSPVKTAGRTSVDSQNSSKPVGAIPKKFPGLIPIYKTDLLNEGKLQSAKSLNAEKSGPRGLSAQLPENGRYRKTTISSKPDGGQKSSLQLPYGSSFRQQVDLVKRTSNYDSNCVQPQSKSPQCQSGTMPHKIAEKTTNSIPPEEITIDDSDDEDVSQRTHSSHS